MAGGVRDRYGTTIAPGGLALVHRLLNTDAIGAHGDELAEPSSARPWLRAALIEWAVHQGSCEPSIELAPDDLPRLRELRRTIRAMLMNAPNASSVTASLDIELSPDGTTSVRPRGRSAAGWLRSAVLAECLASQIAGTWPRLKVCANPACQVVFYDRSRNRSGVWHDVRVCGNRINLRASRARRRGGARRPAGSGSPDRAEG